MRFYLLTFLTIILSFSLMITTADAKRFGGGKSFGTSRAYSSHSNTNYFTSPKSAVNPTKSSLSKWLGPLAGFALGGLVASLFMGHGLGSGLLSWLMIGGILFFIWNLFKKMQFNSTKFQNQSYQTEPVSQFTDLANNKKPSLKVITENDGNTLAFDKEAFLRHAKTIFLRLQAAYDNKNFADIREFTAPVVFAEIQMQIQERGEAINVTQVLHIDAELLEFDPEDDRIASVIFSGKICEDQQKIPETFKEIWHFRQDKISQEWSVIGIQQMPQ